MKILISQRDILVPPNNWPHDALERAWYTLLSGHELIPVPNLGVINTDINFDCLIFTGGPDSILRHATEDKLFEYAYSLEKPIIGFCHGAFVINDLTGGINETGTAFERVTHENNQHLINLEGELVEVNTYHSQIVRKLGPNMLPIASAIVDGSIEAFKHVGKEIYGIVWHPERMKTPILPDSVNQLLKITKEK